MLSRRFPTAVAGRDPATGWVALRFPALPDVALARVPRSRSAWSRPEVRRPGRRRAGSLHGRGAARVLIAGTRKSRGPDGLRRPAPHRCWRSLSRAACRRPAGKDSCLALRRRFAGGDHLDLRRQDRHLGRREHYLIDVSLLLGRRELRSAGRPRDRASWPLRPLQPGRRPVATACLAIGGPNLERLGCRLARSVRWPRAWPAQ